MTILYLLVCIISAFLLGVIVCNYYFVIPVQQRNSRLIGKLNQKEWQINEWQRAYEKANSDFMKLSEIHNSVIKPKVELMPTHNDGWIKWTWTEEKPYPETLDTIVDVKFGDGEIFEQESVNCWQCSGSFVEGDCWTKRENIADTIVAYRVVN